MTSRAEVIRYLDEGTGLPYTPLVVRVVGERELRIWTLMCRQVQAPAGALADAIIAEAIQHAACDVALQKALADLSLDLAADTDRPVCRVCGCHRSAPCLGGCRWTADPLMLGELCSTCWRFLGFAAPSDGSHARKGGTP